MGRGRGEGGMEEGVTGNQSLQKALGVRGKGKGRGSIRGATKLK